MNCIHDCQLKSIYEAAEEINFFDRLLLIFIRLRSAFLRRARKLGLVRSSTIASHPNIEANISMIPSDPQTGHSLNVGDTVQILPFEEIKKTLSETYRTQGLGFMTAMTRYCGTRRKVLKKVNYIFDEQPWEMRKIKKVFILDGTICKGEGMFSKEGCDRCCYFFWKETWLKKI